MFHRLFHSSRYDNFLDNSSLVYTPEFLSRPFHYTRYSIIIPADLAMFSEEIPILSKQSFDPYSDLFDISYQQKCHGLKIMTFQ
jgi:hypothetical protein